MEDGAKSKRLVQLTVAAALDLASIDNATAAMWGQRQADSYTGFLVNAIQNLALDPTQGRLTTRIPGIRTFVAKVNRKRSTNGHRLIYREIEGGIRVIRILHTAMQWQDHVSQDEILG